MTGYLKPALVDIAKSESLLTKPLPSVIWLAICFKIGTLKRRCVYCKRNTGQSEYARY